MYQNKTHVEKRPVPLVIAGSGRSGTTWVLDAIACANGMRTVFEPLHESVGKIAYRYAGRYVDPSSEEAELKCFMDEILSGELHTLWTDYRTLSDRLKPGLRMFSSPRKVIELYGHYRNLLDNYRSRRLEKKDCGIAVKFIRANLLLDWLASHYDLKMLFVIRHPCAVIESKIRLDATAVKVGLKHGGADWNPHSLLERYLEDEKLRSTYLGKYIDRYGRRAFSEVQAHAFIWCIENVAALVNLNANKVCITYYEELVLNGHVEWPRIARELALEHFPEPGRLGKPSQQASEDYRSNKSGTDRLSRWQTRLNDKEVSQIDEVLKLFDIGIYSVNKATPLHDMEDSGQDRQTR